MAVEQLPAEAQNAITAAAVDLIKAGHAGIAGPTFDRLVTATMNELYETHARGNAATTVAVFAHLITTIGRVSVRLAHGWDEAADGTPAAAYLAEVAVLAAHGRD